MKKGLFIFLTIIFLTACGSDDNTELDNFTSAFNNAAESRDVKKLDSDEFGEIKVEDGRGWQALYDSNDYTIDAKYEDGENLSGYYLVIDNRDSFEMQSGDGYWTGVTIARALDLDSKNYIHEYGKALKTTSHSYIDSDYIVSFTNPGEDGLTSAGMIINFDKR